LGSQITILSKKKKKKLATPSFSTNPPFLKLQLDETNQHQWTSQKKTFRSAINVTHQSSLIPRMHQLVIIEEFQVGFINK
jgi:hypothetical protein